MLLHEWVLSYLLRYKTGSALFFLHYPGYRLHLCPPLMGTSTISAPSTKQIYRVRKSWADAKSQLGAYSSLENAKKACKVGYSVFDANGNVVYTNGSKFTKGQKVAIRANTPLFASAETTSVTRRFSGTYYLYDGIACKNGRYRITTKPEFCGKAPVGSYVTGYVSYDNFK